MLDSEGYRLGVGMVVTDLCGRVLWCKRCKFDAWQFPQGGIEPGETNEEAMWRELFEELGLRSEHVEVQDVLEDWLRYDLPPGWRNGESALPFCGQKHIWFLLSLVGGEECVDLEAAAGREFDQWRWVDWWHPPQEVVEFKRGVYRQMLESFASRLGLK